jgi:hemerythrin-like domain-containing protein
VEKAIEVLMNEHRLIERALDSLDAYASEVRMGRPAARDVVGEYAAFFRGFADGCHHGKEEDILFQRMVERGFPREAGPLAVMYHEHEVGRGHVRTLGAIAAARLVGEAASPESTLALHRRALDRGVMLRPIGDCLYLAPPLATPVERIPALVQSIAASLAE